MLSELGVTNAMIEQGLIVPNYQYRDRNSDEVADFQMYRLRDDTQHPYRLQCEQWKKTRISVSELGKYAHAEVRYGEKLVGYRQESDGVSLLTYSDGMASTAFTGLIWSEQTEQIALFADLAA